VITSRPAGTLLERDGELAALEALFDAAIAGEGGALYVSGPPGIGKTALLARARRSARARGMTTLHAAGVDLARELPFGVAVDLVAPLLRDAQSHELLAGAAAPAQALVRGGPLDGDELRLLHALYWVVANLADRGPVAVFVDDAHWADPLSLRFALFLAQRIADLPAALVLAARQGEPDAPVELLRSMTGRPGVVHAELGPLTPAGVAEMVRGARPDAPEAFCTACARLTRGNPLLLRELLRAADAAGIRSDAPERLGDLAPRGILDGVLVRLDRLPDPARAVAEATAVLGDGPLHLAGALAGTDMPATASAVDALTRAEILELDDRVRFVHPLLRSAVHAELPPGRRALLHRRAAALLAQEGGTSAAVAAHLLAAPAAGDAWAVARLLDGAADAVDRGAPATAVRFLRRALDEPPAPDARPEVLLRLAEAEAAAGEPEAVERLEQALRLVSSTSDRARIRIRLGWMLHKRGRLEESAAVFADGLTELDGHAPGHEDQ
jgi:predicted ATPase